MNRLEKAINPILIVTIGLASCRPVQPKIPSSLEPPASPPGLVTPSIETLIPPISVVLQTPEASEISEKPSPFKNINYGQYRQLDGSLTIIGGIPGSNIRKNNPNVNVIPINGADEVQINTLYNKDYPKSIVGFMIDINSQMQIFNASDTKGGIIGHLPDGTEVRLENNLWTYEKNGLRYFFNPVVANQEGKPFGYPGLVKDKSDAFVFGIFNADGSLVGETTLESPFKTVDQIARSAGFNSDLSQVVSAGLNQQGNLEVYDGQGKILQTFKYLALTLPEPPTPTATATPTEVPPPPEFLALAEKYGFPYEVVSGGKVTVNLIDGKSVVVNPKQVGDWPMWKDVWEQDSNFYLVVKDDNGIPQLRYVEGKGWENVEQTSMIDAFGNTVPGWVVEASSVWDEKPPLITNNDGRVLNLEEIFSVNCSSNGLCNSLAISYVKQWRLLEFMASDGTKMQSLQIDFVFNNGEQIITVRSQTRDVDGYLAPKTGITVKEFMDLFVPGKKVYLGAQWWNPSSSITSQDEAKMFFGHFNGESAPAWLDINNNPFITELSSAMNIGQWGTKKFSESYLLDIFRGKHGEFVDLSNSVYIFNN